MGKQSKQGDINQAGGGTRSRTLAKSFASPPAVDMVPCVPVRLSTEDGRRD
jgi:hypothetical protein